MQLSLFPEPSLPIKPQPNYGELMTAFNRKTGWVRVSSEDMQTFTIRGGAHDGTVIGRDFIHLFQSAQAMSRQYAAEDGSKCEFCDAPAVHCIQGKNSCDDSRCKYMAWTEDHEDHG